MFDKMYEAERRPMWLKGSSQREACTQSSVTTVTEVSKVKRDQIMPFSKHRCLHTIWDLVEVQIQEVRGGA